MLVRMIPSLAICGHATPALIETAELALEVPGQPLCVEYSFDPENVRSALEDTRFLRTLAPESAEIRFHFPLGHIELADLDPDAGERALSRFFSAVEVVAEAGGEFLTVHAALPMGAHEFKVFGETKDRLRRLVEFGRDRGVTVALENLRWGLTSHPRHFIDLVEWSGSAVTLDVGHAVSSDVAESGAYSGAEFARLVAPRIVGAHVYDREAPHHIAPTDLDRIGETLRVLLGETGCRWWVIELFSADEIRSTRALLLDFLAQEAIT
jgi:sugar phosphate isomerase/epimerase